MSEATAMDSVDTAGAPPAAPTAAVTAGSLLRDAREAAGLHIAALAVALKVPVKKLEALEADRLDLLPDAVFVRALASSVCRTLKIDAAPVLERLPQTAKPRLIQDEAGINAPFRAPGDAPRPTLAGQVSRPAMLAVVALLLGALVLILLPSVQREGFPGRGSAVQEVALVTPAPAPAAVPNPAPADTAQAAPASSTPAPAQGTTLAPQVAAATPALTAAASTPTVASPTVVISPELSAKVTPSPARTAMPAAAGSPAPAGIVVFTTKGESWVEVMDARGVPALRRTLAPGEAVAASGALPLTVTVGRADATDVQVRGKPFNLAAVSRDNVARFEVK